MSKGNGWDQIPARANTKKRVKRIGNLIAVSPTAHGIDEDENVSFDLVINLLCDEYEKKKEMRSPPVIMPNVMTSRK